MVGLKLGPGWTNHAFDKLFWSHEAKINDLSGVSQRVITYDAWLVESQPYIQPYNNPIAIVYPPADSQGTSDKVIVNLELAVTVISDTDGGHILFVHLRPEPFFRTGASGQTTPSPSKRRIEYPMKPRDLPAFGSNGTMSSAH